MRISGQFIKIRKQYGIVAGIILIVFIIALSFFLPKNRFQQAKERLARNPNDAEARLVLIEEYLKNNQLEAAQKELSLASSTEAIHPRFVQLWQKFYQSSPEDIEKLIAYWEKIVVEKPDYRDAYLQLALLHYKIYQNEKAGEYLEQALVLDPNFEPASKLEERLEY